MKRLFVLLMVCIGTYSYAGVENITVCGIHQVSNDGRHFLTVRLGNNQSSLQELFSTNQQAAKLLDLMKTNQNYCVVGGFDFSRPNEGISVFAVQHISSNSLNLRKKGVVVNNKLLASQATIIPIKQKQLVLGFGDGHFPPGTIKNANGKFQLVLPQNFTFKSVIFAENFDSMCEIYSASPFAPHTLELTIGPSSAETSRCILNFQLSNGATGQIIGIFSSGN